MEYLLSMASIPMTQLYVIFKTNSDLDAGLSSRSLKRGTRGTVHQLHSSGRGDS